MITTALAVILLTIVWWRTVVWMLNAFISDAHLARQQELHGWHWWKWSRRSCDLPCCDAFHRRRDRSL